MLQAHEAIEELQGKLVPDELEGIEHAFSLIGHLICKCWNGNKKGQFGWYYGRERQLEFVFNGNPGLEVGLYHGGDYHGHNIVAFAIDMGAKRILAHAFNCVSHYGSSSEHAEERLIDGLFRAIQRSFKGKQLPEHTWVVSSLEPCHQCAGKLVMAGVERVIFLQEDGWIHGTLDAMLTFQLSAVSDRPMMQPISFRSLSSGFDGVFRNGVPDFEASFTAWKADLLKPENENGADGHVWKASETHPRNARRGRGSPPLGYDYTQRKREVSPSVTDFLCSDIAKGLFEQLLWAENDPVLVSPGAGLWEHACKTYWNELVALNDHVLWRRHNFH